MSKNVTSPAGEKIEIVNDNDWLEATGDTPKGLQMWYGGWKPYYFRALWEHGEFSDPVSGRAMAKLRDYILEHYPDAAEMNAGGKGISAFFNSNPMAFDRNTNAKRTYSVKLVAMPHIWYEKMTADIAQAAYFAPESAPELDIPIGPPVWDEIAHAHPAQDASPVTVILPPLPDPDVEPLPELPLDQLASQQIAMSLLTEVITLIQSGNVDDQRLIILRKELDQTQNRLAQRLEENDRMRQQLRAAGDEIAALKVERDGLRQRNRLLEHNLNEASKNAGREVSAEVNRRIEQFMRERPNPKGPDDA